jgi:uncharacterized protein (DUF427 family)
MECPLNAGPASDCRFDCPELCKDCDRLPVLQSKQVSWQKQSGKVAESNQCVEVEGNQYFPPDTIKAEHFKPSATHTVCPWKGTASYYDVEVGGKRNHDAAWFYPEPKPAAKQIKGYVAFWRGVKVEK